MRAIPLIVALLWFAVPTGAEQADVRAELEAVRDELRELNSSVKQLLLLFNESLALERRSSLIEQVARLDETILAQEKALGVVEATIHGLAEEIAILHQEVSQMERQLRSRGELADAFEENLRGMLASHGEKIVHRERNMADQEAKAAELRLTIAGRKKTLSTLEEALTAP